MTLDKTNISEVVNNARELLKKDEQISPALRAMFEMLLTIITLLAGRLSLTSRNSSKPPSSDMNRKKDKKADSTKKPGGQPGRVGVNLQPVDTPDKTISIKVDKSKLPKGSYKEVGFESRQVIDIEISCIITEYRAQVVEDNRGNRYVADFPEGVTRPIQYGQSIKSQAVYLSQSQLIPYERVADYFADEANIPLSVGSLFNFNQEAYNRLESFDMLAKKKLTEGTLLHNDETGINVNGKRLWLHTASTEKWTYFYPHEKRGHEAMNEIGILPSFKGISVHDHWKPYYTYKHCRHALCNAHHLRELQWVIDNQGYAWAKEMQNLLVETNRLVSASNTHKLEEEVANAIRVRYRAIIASGLTEMPLIGEPIVIEGTKKRGRIKKTKELNLLLRLRNYEDDVLRFMEVSYVPFTNNRGGNDIRMTKVQQKISGCFKSIEGAKIFCRIRSYLLTAQKHGVSPTEALKCLFAGKLPECFFNNE
jgi:transposase